MNTRAATGGQIAHRFYVSSRFLPTNSLQKKLSNGFHSLTINWAKPSCNGFFLQMAFTFLPQPIPYPPLKPASNDWPCYWINISSESAKIKQRLHQLLEQPGAPWLIAIDGIGGIGKSSLAAALIREIIPTDRFYNVAWVSAKQEEYFYLRPAWNLSIAPLWTPIL